MNNEDTEIKNLIGKPYWENRHLLKYGGTVDSKGIIRQAYGKDEVKRCFKKIGHRWYNLKKQTNEWIFDLTKCPDCNTPQVLKHMKRGSKCDNPECDCILEVYARQGKNYGRLMWTNENWD